MAVGTWLAGGHGEATSVSHFNARQLTEEADAVIVGQVRNVTDHQEGEVVWNEGTVDVIEVLKGSLEKGSQVSLWQRWVPGPTDDESWATGTFARALREYAHTTLKVGGPGVLFLGYDPQTARWLYRFGVKASQHAINAVRTQVSDFMILPPPYWAVVNPDHIDYIE